MNALPIHCPSCTQSLLVSELSCKKCHTKISGSYTLPMLLKLPIDDQAFLFEFIMTSGSLKQMAGKLNKSYPTVRNRLDDIIENINTLNKTE